MSINTNTSILTFILFSLTYLSSCERNKTLSPSSRSTEKKIVSFSQKTNGVNLVATSYKIDSNHLLPVVKINANSVAIVPFGFIRSGQSNVEFNLDWQWHGEKKAGTIEQIALAHSAKLSVLLKPHLWTHDGWVGDLEFNNETAWQEFESSYTKFIIEFAQIADSMKVEKFCVGVELKKVANKRPQFWSSLIDSIRTHYSGKLTYAANWDNYSAITFWSKLDFIGIEAYFPLSEDKTPSVKKLKINWNPIKADIKTLAITEGKPVLFTEFGYRNIDYTGKEPWNTEGNSTLNHSGQKNGFTAIFTTFWNEPWFAGGYLWKWYPEHRKAGGKETNRFTPQNKPAEIIISDFYKSKNWK